MNKNNLKQILKSSGKEISTQTDLYWFTLIPKEPHLAPRNYWVSTMQSITNYKHTTTKEVILIPSRTHTSFGTPQIRTSSDSVNTSTYRITNQEEIGLITPGTNQNKVHSKSYSTLREKSKALSNIRENLISKTDLVSYLLCNRTFILQLAVENIYYKSRISLKTFKAYLTHLTKFC